MNETMVTVCGNVVADPEPRVTKNAERRFTTFRIASTPRRLVGSEYVDGPTSFLNVVAFNRLGANAHRSVKKGDAVIVQGRLRVSQWSSGERSGTSVEIDAYAIGHDLNRGTTTYHRGSVGWPGSDRMDTSDVRDAIASTELGGAPVAPPEELDRVETDMLPPPEDPSEVDQTGAGEVLSFAPGPDAEATGELADSSEGADTGTDGEVRTGRWRRAG
ncbi:MAG: single-stranded DNA-binding protein [Dermatophilaceae bacterium]